MRRLVTVLTIVVVVLFMVSLTFGPARIGAIESLYALISGDSGALTLVMREVRLPRTILAVMVGAGLGIAGAAMQGYLRNPLAEPGLLGVSSSAALGAVLAIQSGFASYFFMGLPIMALASAVIGVVLVIFLAGSQGSSLSLILAGVAISALAAALTSLVLNLSSNPFAANEIIFWMMGSLADRSLTHVWIASPFILVGVVMLGTLGRGLDALILGEDATEAMGIRINKLQLILILGTASIVGASTAVAGAISFVGLVVPHILRPLVGSQPSKLLLVSALGGSIMLLAADIAVRLILPTRDLKLGVVTALVGTPLFLCLIYKARRQYL